MNYKIFDISKYEYNEENNILKLYYKIDELEFIEEINFNPNKLKLRVLNDSERLALNLAFTYLHIVAGVSYYKALLPNEIKISTIKITKEQKEFFDKIYLNGLGEFAFKNNVNLSDKINFPYSDAAENNGINLKLNNDFIVPIGGGKDSIVSLDMLQKIKNQKLYTFSVNIAKPIKDCCELSDCENISVSRKIAPLLFEINKNPEKYNAYNGHVPITSIIAFISVAAGILYNCNTTVISNECSANIGNTMHDGMIVNHQWSKSFEAEKSIHDFIQKYITPDFSYFSLLRPIYEIHIAKLFSKIKKYDAVFASCNKNFKIIKNEKPLRWCCNCDKCRFVFLILAPFYKKDDLVKIFGKDLLNDETQYQGYQELTGFSGYKPFECVGEIEESITAFYLLRNSDFKNDSVVLKINEKINQKYTEENLKSFVKKYFGYNFKNTLLNNNFKDLFEEYVK